MAVARTSSPKTWPHSLKALVRGEDHGAAFVAAGDELEDHVGFGPVQRQVADFVDHQDGGPQVGLELPVEPAGGLGGAELADQVVEGGEVDRVAGLAGGDGQRDGEHGLADAGRAEQGDVGLGVDERQGGEVADLAGVEVGLEREVELVQGLVVRQPGQLQRVAEPAAFAQPEFFLEHQVDEVEVAHLGGLGAVDELGDGVGQVGQAEPGGVVTDPVGGQLLIGSPSWCAWWWRRGS